MDYKKLIILAFLIDCLPLVTFAGRKDNILFQKKELETIKKDVEASRQKLDSLKRLEMGMQTEISESNQKIATNKKVIRRLSRELEQLQKEKKNVESVLDKRQLQLELTRRRYLGNIRQFYLATHKPPDIFSEDPNEELKINRQVVYLTAIASFESGNVNQASQYLLETRKKMEQLSGEKKKISRLKRKKETSTVLVSTQKRKQQRSLEHIRREKTEEADLILTLEQAAREMEQIIARLQREVELRRSDRRDLDISTSVFASLQGQLKSPYRGKIIVPFGELIDPVTKLKSFSSGITIKGKHGRNVVAVASGTVAYVGNLRGYGNFIIINHDDFYYTTYAGLGKTFVSTNEYILTGNKLAVSDKDGLVKFELRQGRKPLDPVKWIKIDSF